MRTRLLCGLLFGLVLCATSTTPVGAAGVDTYPKNHAIDVLHYAFELRLADATNRIEGRTTVQVRFLTDGVDGFELDLVGLAAGGETGMSVSRVEELIGNAATPPETGAVRATDAGAVRATDAGAELQVAHRADRLRITLPRPALRGEVRRFRVTYGGVPATGLVIGDNKHGDRTFFSDNWPDKARHWLPTIDHPYEKATSEMIVTAPLHYQVISNGLLLEETQLVADAAGGAGWRRTHWKQSVPIAPWLFVLGAARFAVDYYDDFDGKSLQTWVYAQDRDAGFYDFAVPTKDVMRFYSDRIGPYAYEKLANVQSNSVGGGMEAATAIFYGDASVTGQRTERWRNVIIHEIAHQWWGNAVTEDDWDHVWLSEGFATYFTLLYREYAYGRDDFLRGLAEARERVVDFYADNPDYRIVHDNLDDMARVSNGMTYQKGAWFLHMLRGLIGEDRFWEGIREYYRLYRDRNASTDDFREVMENTFEPAIDLREFFRQWLYQGGLPELRATWTWDATAGELVVDIEQVAPGGYTFEMPIPIAVTVPAAAGRGGRRGAGSGARGGAGGATTLVRRVMMGAGATRTRLPLDAAPIAVELDPDHWVLMNADLQESRPR